jgi:hypothetical protein
MPLDATLSRELKEEYQKQKKLEEARQESIRKSIQSSIQAIPETPVGWTKTAISLSAKHRKAIREGHFHVFFLAFVLALVEDGLLDLISIIPFVGPLVTLAPSSFIFVYLFIFLWGKGTLKLKLIRYTLLFFDLFVPFFNILPFNTFCVWWAYRNAKKDYRTAVRAEKKAGEVLNA